MEKLCPLCGRVLVPGPSTNLHHLVPKSLGGTEVVELHRICHQKIHSLFSERELKNTFNTISKIKEHEEIKKFIKWVRKKAPEFYDKNDTANRKR